MLGQFKQKRSNKNSLVKDREKKYIEQKIVLDAAGGMQTSVAPMAIKDNKLSYMYNIMIEKNRLKTRHGYIEFGNGLPLPNAIVQTHQYSKYDGTQYLVVFTTKDIYVYNSTTGYWDLVTKNLLIDDCEAAWTGTSVNVTVTASTAWFRYGAKSAKIAIAALNTTGVAAYFDFAAKDLHTYSHLHFYVKSSIDLAAGDIQILLDNTPACASPLETIDIPALTANVPLEVEIALATPAGDTAIASVGLNIAVDKGACDIYIDDIRAVACLTGDTSNKFSCESIYNSATSEMYFIASNGIDNIQFWTGTGNWADLGGSPDKAKILKNFSNYLILLNCNSGGNAYPQKIGWCVNTKPTDWSGAGSGNNSLASSTGEIMGCEILQSQLVIFLESSIAMMYLVGGIYAGTSTPIPFEFNENKTIGTGCAAKGSIQSLGDTILFLGWDDFYLFDGFSCVGVGSDIIDDFLDTTNPGKLDLIHSHIFEEWGLYTIFVASTSSSEVDSCWVYDYVNKKWLGKWKYANNFASSGFYQSIDAKTIGQLTGTIGSLTWRIGSKALTSFSTISLFGDYNGYVYQIDETVTNDNGTKINSYFDTKEYALNLEQYIRAVEMFLYAVGTTVDVLISTDGGKTFVNKETLTINGDISVPNISREIDTTSKRIMFRFQNNILDGWFEIVGWNFRYIEKESEV